jgi:hypothetical protein
MRVAAIATALALAAAPIGAGVETRAAHGRIHLEARAAPLCDVLDDLARKTGMKVVYEGARPRELITTTLDRDTLVETLAAVLEGFDLTYAIQLDATGTRAVTLVLVAGGSSKTGGAPGRSASADPERPEPADPGFPEPEADDFVDEPVDPTTVVRDRVVTDPGTNEPYPVPPDILPQEAYQPPADFHVQGYPAGAQPPAEPAPTPAPTPMPAPPGPQPQPTPTAPPDNAPGI